jgi:hypothetical protein
MYQLLLLLLLLLPAAVAAGIALLRCALLLALK